ncbi:hypothetical protein ERJ75_001771000 [Trypanosoma vivax]|nr:hypothetical protein ERJ75_001771000 [Trypanosoma vivax]
MRATRSAKAPHAAEMEIRRTKRSALRPIANIEADAALSRLSSDALPSGDETRYGELRPRGRVTTKCVVRLFSRSLFAGGRRPGEARRHTDAAEIKQGGEERDALSSDHGHTRKCAAQADGTRYGAPRQAPTRGQAEGAAGRGQAGACGGGYAQKGDECSTLKE